MKILVAALASILAVGSLTIALLAYADSRTPPTTTTTTIDLELARCVAIKTHQYVLDYRDLETARYLANTTCTGRVPIPSLPPPPPD